MAPIGEVPADYEATAGHTDSAVRDKTGKTWPQWLQALDALGAMEMSHRDIAAHVRETTGSAWWGQTVTIGYERIRGKRAIGQSCEGDFQAAKSKTIKASRAQVFAALLEVESQPDWPEELALFGSTEPKSVRFRSTDGSRAALWLTDKGEAKCSVSVSHSQLASAEAAEAMKLFWKGQLDQLAERLG